MTVFLLKTEEIEALPREFCERNFPGRLKGSVRTTAIGAGAMIRYLTGLPETDIRYNENGKPYTENGPHFNISHSRDLVAGVSSEAPVGIDLEHSGRKHEGIEKRVFSPEERSLINSGADDRLFFTAWTLKEACVKLFGKSLAKELTSFSILPHLRPYGLFKNRRYRRLCALRLFGKGTVRSDSRFSHVRGYSKRRK